VADSHAQPAAAPPEPCSFSAEATVEQCRQRGDHLFDPVRFRVIEAMARRTASHEGEARHLLDGKVARLLAHYSADQQLARAAPAQAHVDAGQSPREGGPLARLAEHIARHTPGGPQPELKALTQFRQTWTRLKADQRLTQSLAKVPANAGPLNSHHLVHRTLKLMRELSPDYLHRFMAHVDALLWLEQAATAAVAKVGDTPRGPAARKPARGKG
jgi:hypothetical protein